MTKLMFMAAGAIVAVAATAGSAQGQPVTHSPNIHEVREEKQAAALTAHDTRLAEDANIAHHRADVRKADLDAFHKKEAARHAYEAKHDSAVTKP